MYELSESHGPSGIVVRRVARMGAPPAVVAAILSAHAPNEPAHGRETSAPAHGARHLSSARSSSRTAWCQPWDVPGWRNGDRDCTAAPGGLCRRL